MLDWKLVKKRLRVANRFHDDDYRAKMLETLNEVAHKIVACNHSAVDAIRKIESLLKAQRKIATKASTGQ